MIAPPSVVGSLPYVIIICILWVLGISGTASKRSLKTEIAVKLGQKQSKGKKRPISSAQGASTSDPGVVGNVWVSKYTIPRPYEDNVRQAVFKAIDDLGMETFNVYNLPKLPELYPVGVEWTGYRKDAKPKTKEPADLNEKDKYRHIMMECKSEVTILYFHGGAYYLLDPASHRGAVGKLCELTKGRAMSVRYRLAPQNPFPAALIDAFVAYLSLLYPPEGAPHGPCDPQSIIFAGDSAGGNLALVLLQLVLQLKKSAGGAKPKVVFNGNVVEVPVPGGVATLSPWCDMTSSFNSVTTNAKWDYLNPQWQPERIPPCPAWPASPPRVEIYCEGSALCHPLVSPVIGDNWSDAPPMFFAVGQELLTDEAAALACKMALQGVPVVYEEYEGLPHCFSLVLPTLPASKLVFEEWAKFCTNAVKRDIRNKGTYYLAKSLEAKTIHVSQLLTNMKMTELSIPERMRRKQFQAIKEFNEREEARIGALKTG